MKKQLNVLFVTHNLPNTYGGATMRAYYLIKYFYKKYGHNIILISLSNSSLTDVSNYCSSVHIYEDRASKKDVLKSYILNGFGLANVLEKMKSNNGIIDVSFYSRKKIQKVVDNIIEKKDIDVIYTDSAMAGYVAKSKIAKLVDAVDINYPSFYEYYINEKKLTDKIYYLFMFLISYMRETLIFKNFDYCTVVTELDKHYVSGLNNVLVIPIGVDHTYYSPITSNVIKSSILYTGLMSGKKNIDAVFYFYKHVFPLLKKKVPDLKWFVVGKDPPQEIQDLHNGESLFVTGFVNDIRSYLNRTEVFICPMFFGSGIKNKVLEALSNSKAVVTTSIGALGINFRDGYDLMISNTSHSFVRNIGLLFSDAEKRKQLGENGRELILKDHSWRNIASRFNRIFLIMCQK